ncbi:uncharacterized protein ACBT44_016779 isoform 3-T3 [Syngnathus typhle]
MFRAHLQVKVGHRISKRSLVTRSLSCCYDAIQISALLKNKGVEQTEMKHTGVFSVKGHSGFNWSLSRLDLVRVNPALDIKCVLDPKQDAKRSDVCRSRCCGL